VEHQSQIEEMKDYLCSMLHFNGDNAAQNRPMPVYVQDKAEVILIEDSESDSDEVQGETEWSEDTYDEAKVYETECEYQNTIPPPTLHKHDVLRHVITWDCFSSYRLGCSGGALNSSSLPNLSDNDEDLSTSYTSHLRGLRFDNLLAPAKDLAAIASTHSELYSIVLIGLQRAVTLAKRHLALKNQESIIAQAGSTLRTQGDASSSTIPTHNMQDDRPTPQLKRCRSFTRDTSK
jgi:hypothetical protein